MPMLILQTYILNLIFYCECLAAAAAAAAESFQSCPTLCDPIDGSPPGSAIPGILESLLTPAFEEAGVRIRSTEGVRNAGEAGETINCSRQ